MGRFRAMDALCISHYLNVLSFTNY